MKSLLMLVSAMLAAPAEGSPDARVIVAARGNTTVHIVAGSGIALDDLRDWCVRYLRQRGYHSLAAEGGDSLQAEDPVWALETLDRHPVAESLGVDVSFLENARADAYVLAALPAGETGRVLIVGRDPSGVRAGVARLIALLQGDEGTLTAPSGLLQHSPFIPVRRLHVCVTGRIAQGNEWCVAHGLPADGRWADTLWTNWSDDRIREYAEQLWLLGLNSVEVPEIRGYRGVFSDEELARDVTPKLRVFMRALRDHGLQVSQFVWGQSLFVEGRNLCWNDPSERDTMRKEYARLAETYGDLVDHVVVHVGDPGGCDRNGCDPYRTTQEIAVAILEACRRVNPDVTVTLSTWANAGFWNGKDQEGFLDERYSPREIAIALHRWYDGDPARRVVDAGRAVDIWGWYLSDFELALDNVLLMRRLDRYFSSLPPEAADRIRALSTEICFQGWPQILNAYVSAQKMGSPMRDLGEIEREFCAGVFGDANAGAMTAVYRACEAYVHPDRYYGFIPKEDCLPVVFGTAEYNLQLREALEAAETVRFAEDFIPRMTTATPPQSLFDYLKRNLSLIAAYSAGTERLLNARAGGASAEEIEAIRAEVNAAAEPLRDDPDYGPLSSAFERL